MIGNKGGRPAFFDTPEELQKMCEGYYKHCEKNEKPVTITGLALFLGFESRQSFYDYEKREQFSYVIKRNRLRVESEYECRLSTHNPTGAIFALKNMGWRDRHELEQSGEINITVEEKSIS